MKFSWLLSLTLILTGCRISWIPRSASDNTLRISLGSDPLVIDPQLAETGLAVFLAEQLTSTLLEVDDSLQIHTKDAERFFWEDEGRRLKVELKKGLFWSDGKPLQACQYRDGILRALNPQLLSPYADLFFDIIGAEEAKSAKALASVVRIECGNPEAWLSFEVKKPYSSKLLYALAFANSAPARLDLMSKPDQSWLLPRDGQKGVSNGPYILAKWDRDQRVKLEARGNAPSFDRAQIANIDMPVVRDANTAFTMYESGELDILDEVPPIQLKKIIDRKDRHTSPWLTTYMVGFSFKSNPALANVKLRQALAFTAHQDEIPLLLPGGEEAAKGWVPPALIPESYRPHSSLYNPALAKKLMPSSTVNNKKRLQLYFNNGERHKLLMERLAHNFEQDLKLKILLEPIEWKVLLSTLKFKAPDMYRYAWTAVYPDVLFFLEIFHSKNINNFGGYRNTEYDRLIEELSSVELRQRDASFWHKVQRAQDILVREDPALIPIYHYAKNTLIKTRVKGLKVSARGLGALKNAYY